MKVIYDPEFLGLQVTKKMGEELIVFCPYHSDSNPSAEYNVNKGVFYCFGCQTGRTAEQLAEDLGGSLVPIGETELDYVPKKGEETDWKRLLINPLASENEYLKERKVRRQDIWRFGIKENDDGIIFPLEDIFENVQGIQIRHYSKKPKYLFHGKRTKLWPIKNALKPGKIFITEGVFGSLRAQRYEVNSVAMLGASSVEPIANFIKGQGHLEPYAVMDLDYAGLLAAGKFVLMGIPAILHKFEADPDEWSVSKWKNVYTYTHVFRTYDVNQIIDRSEEPGRLERTLKKFWKKLELERNRRSKNG